MKHAKDMRRELEKQVTGLKEEVDQLRNKSKQDAVQMQSLQDDLIGLEKVKANKEFEYKQLMQKFEQEKSDFKVSVDLKLERRKFLNSVSVMVMYMEFQFIEKFCS